MCASVKFKDRCCNPFNEPLHSSKLKKPSVRVVSKSILEKVYFLEPNDVLCTTCRKKIGKMSASDICEYMPSINCTFHHLSFLINLFVMLRLAAIKRTINSKSSDVLNDNNREISD